MRDGRLENKTPRHTHRPLLQTQAFPPGLLLTVYFLLSSFGATVDSLWYSVGGEMLGGIHMREGRLENKTRHTHTCYLHSVFTNTGYPRSHKHRLSAFTYHVFLIIFLWRNSGEKLEDTHAVFVFFKWEDDMCVCVFFFFWRSESFGKL
jgi:hypothetical protein